MLLSIRGLSIGFANQDTDVVKNVSLELRAGEILGIIGESGSGKSLIANSIMQLNRSFTRQTGKILFDGMNLLEVDNKVLYSIRGSKIAIVFQDPLASLNPLKDIHSQIAEAILIHNNSVNSDYVRSRTEELLDMVGIAHFKRQYNTYPHEISGGQRQRVMIAIAIANKPRILIADEPTTALDAKTQESIVDLLHGLRETQGMSIIFITHDLSLTRSLADRVCVIKKGIIRECGITKDVYENPQHKYTKQLMLSNKPVRVQSVPDKEFVLEINNLSYIAKKNFLFHVKKKTILQNISFGLHRRETIGIIGESGAGKSTLVKSILGIIKPTGKIVLLGKDVGVHDKLRHQEMQVVLQDPFSSLNPSMRVGEIVSEGIVTHNLLSNKDEIYNTITNMISSVGLKESIIDKYPHECSGGERQRIAIARVLAVRPSVVIMDECTSSLDAVNERRIVHLLLSLQEHFNLSYILVSHNLEVVRSMSHRVYRIENGQITDSNCF
ncbi:Uncharacterized ABC transporter ATP-binding protein YejF [Candidatus Xenohaliotis californiensis]|uniref:Uncharacterized ABC transporter ATP-binding protein YejF n=1 Tax=Candidatus Xenohaliotis californiensis TaxID=84677 RepID=A0ABM9N951_9RICK|nr:Uncharacterized ABC transporter ATP-binding protein YejF [Candidatus Xenohaliotis californiensis]